MAKSFNSNTSSIGRWAVILAPAIAVCLALSVSVAQSETKGASFDCRKARSADEKAVCASPELSRLDAQLQDLYKTARSCALMGARGAYHDDQTDWLAKRHKCASDTTCLRTVYKKRIAELKPDADGARKQRAAGECPDQ